MKLRALLALWATLVGCASAPEASVVASARPEAEGVLAAVNKGEQTLSLISLRTGQTLAKLPTGPNPQEVVFSPDGKLGVVSNMGQGAQAPGKTLTLIDLPGKKVAGEIDLGEHGAPHGVAFLDDDRVLVTSHATDSLVLVNVRQRKVERALSTEGKGTHLVVLAPDRKRAYTANVMTQDVSVIDLEAWKVLKRIPCGNRAEGIAISPDGKLISVGNVGANTVSVIDAEKLSVVKTLDGLRLPIRTFFTPDGSHLLVSCAEAGEIAVFLVRDLTEVKRISLSGIEGLVPLQGPHPMPMNFEKHASGEYVYVVALNCNAVAILDVEALEVVGAFSTGILPDGIGFSSFTLDS